MTERELRALGMAHLGEKYARLAALAQSAGQPADPLTKLDLLTETEEQAAAIKLAVVYLARKHGMSWTEIGTAMGITKQAAQQRYGKKPTGPDPEPDEPLPFGES